MKDQDSGTSTESNKIKAAVMDAMAKYNSKKIQEQKEEQENSKASSTAKRKIPEPQGISNETLVGITEYVKKSEGFSAVLKQRYSDFIVNEIDYHGNVVHLTNQTIPKVPVDEPKPEDIDTSHLTAEQWSAVDEMMKSEEPVAKLKPITVDVTDKSKEERLAIHQALRQKYQDIASNSDTVDGKCTMVISKIKPGRRDPRQKRPPFIKFVLFKENLSTLEAISNLARIMKMKSDVFQYAGTKDKRGRTSQWVTAKNVEPIRLLNSVRNDKKIHVGNFSYPEEVLHLGDLKGNVFKIVLRNVIGEDNTIESNLESLKEVGFINYYGSQRFGTRHVGTHCVGKQLLLGNWAKAIDLILEPPSSTAGFQKDWDLTLARKEWIATKNAEKALSKVKRSINTVEAQLLINLKARGNDLVGALNTVPRNLRLTYIHAYQSFLWNTVVSKRVAKFGLEPVIGDLVLAHEEEVCDPAESNVTEKVEEAECPPEGENGEEASGLIQRIKKKVILLDENNLSDYTIYDVVLPLPGFDVLYPTNEAGEWYTELLQADGLADSGFKQSVKSYNLAGDYRQIMKKPSDLKWKLVHYNDPTISLIASDYDIMQQNFDEPPQIEDGMYKALLLEFGLPPSSYATMALREITKMDMSAQFQVTLNEAAGTKTEPATKRWKPDQASCQPNSGGESIKKETDLLAKEEPVTTSELP